MAALDIVQVAVILVLGVGALSFRSFFAMLVLGCLIAAGVRFAGGHWTPALQASLAGCFCLAAIRWFAAGKVVLTGIIVIAIPSLLISHFLFKASWLISAVNAAVLLVLLPPCILRSLVRFGLVKIPQPTPSSVPTYHHSAHSSRYDHFASSAPSYPRRSEVRNSR